MGEAHQLVVHISSTAMCNSDYSGALFGERSRTSLLPCTSLTSHADAWIVLILPGVQEAEAVFSADCISFDCISFGPASRPGSRISFFRRCAVPLKRRRKHLGASQYMSCS